MSQNRIISVFLDPNSLAVSSVQSINERRVAIADLLNNNSFELNEALMPKDAHGPFVLHFSVQENRLLIDINGQTGEKIHSLLLSLSPLKKTIRDYLMIVEHYHTAIYSASPSQIETLDMGRRGIHNDGAQILINRLVGKITMDFDTARRLFTLICALHIRG